MKQESTKAYDSLREASLIFIIKIKCLSQDKSTSFDKQAG